MNIKVPVRNEVTIYKSFLRTVNWMRKKPLSNKEIEVLAQFMYYNNKYKHLEPKLRKDLIFTKSIKKEMQDALGMKPVVFDNYLKCLRDKGVIVDNEIIKSLQVYPTNNSFTFGFTYELQ